MTRPDRRKEPLAYTAWGLFNYGIPGGVYRTRQQAKDAASASAGEGWARCGAYFEVHRVMVQKSDLKPAKFTAAGKPKLFKRRRHRGLGLPVQQRVDL